MKPNACSLWLWALLALTNACLEAPTQAAPPAGLKCKLVWADEFNGTNLDTTKWERRLGPRRSALWVKEGAELDGQGHCVLRTWADAKGQVYGGALTTADRFRHRYGYYEARVILPKHLGHWAAFWLQTDQHTTPPFSAQANGDEVDIFEYMDVGGDVVSHNIHLAASSDYYEHVGHDPEVKGLSQDGYHTFGLLWTPDRYAFYVDGKMTWQTRWHVSQRELFIILSDEFNFKESKQSGDLPADYAYHEDFFKIDYVRVYDLEDPLPPKVEKESDYLQLVEVLTDEEGARLLREGVAENLQPVLHRKATQVRQLPLVEFNTPTKLGKTTFIDNQLVTGEMNPTNATVIDTLRAQRSSQKVPGDLQEVTLRLQTNRRVGWTKNHQGEKVPNLRSNLGVISRQMLNPNTWYTLYETTDDFEVKGKVIKKNALVLYRVVHAAPGQTPTAAK